MIRRGMDPAKLNAIAAKYYADPLFYENPWKWRRARPAALGRETFEEKRDFDAYCWQWSLKHNVPAPSDWDL